MGAEVEHGIRTPDLLQVGVIGSEAMMGTGAAGVQKPHGVALVAEGGLHADEHVAEVATEHQQVLAIAVEVARRLAPVLLQPFGVRGETFVLLHAHAVRDRELRSSLHRFGIVDHGFHQTLRSLRQVLDVVPLGLHLLHHPMDGAEHIEVGRRADIAFVRREAEHRDRQLLVGAWLDPQR